MKKKLMALLIMFLISTMLFGCGSSDSDSNRNGDSSIETDSEGRIYTSDFAPDTNQIVNYYEVDFQVPDAWKADDSSSEGILAYTMTDGSMTVTGGKSSGNHDLNSEGEQDEVVSSMKTSDSFVETGRETRTILDDTTALYFTCSQDLSDVPVNMSVLAFVTDDRLYMFAIADRQDSEYNHSKDFDKVIDSITWVEEGEDNSEPVDDFFSDEERQNEYETLYTSYQFSELYDYVKQYIDNEGDSISESDSAYIILDLVEPIMEYEDTWTVNHDDFDGSYSLEFEGANQISDSESVSIYLSGSTYTQTIGFRKSGWLFFDKYALSIDGEVVEDNSVKSTSRDEQVISGSTIEESYSSAKIFDKDVCEQLMNSDTAILRFTNNDTNENYDHTLSKEEINALYVSNLISSDWVEFQNLLFDYVNGYEYVPH